jgi:hypothetical protein
VSYPAEARSMVDWRRIPTGVTPSRSTVFIDRRFLKTSILKYSVMCYDFGNRLLDHNAQG